VLLAAQVDRLAAARVPAYDRSLLQREIGGTQKIKGRLLYYFPTDKVRASLTVSSAPMCSASMRVQTDTEDAWIGWHNDSGFFTALSRDMFFDDATGAIIDNPDPNGGLWITDRTVRARVADTPCGC
jgi:hypothetical protein